MDEASQREEALFEAAQQLATPEQREAFLEAACAGNSALRRRVEDLLAMTCHADEFFESGATALGPVPLPNGRGSASGLGVTGCRMIASSS